MSERILTVRLVEAALRESGDSSDRLGDNVINVLVLWPRPGRPESLGSTAGLPLTDHSREGDAPDRPAAFAPLILKEKVEGEVSLLVNVLERDPRGRFARFLRLLSLGAIDGAAGHVFGGVARHLFAGAMSSGVLEIGDGEEDRLEVIAVGEAPLVLSDSRLGELAESGETERVRLPLKAPRVLARPREKGRLAPLRGNGSLVLELAVTR